MPRNRTSLTEEQSREYKILDFKIWVKEQMARNDMTQEEIGKAIGVSQSKVSQMLKIKKKRGDKVDKDPFTIGQALILFDLFEADEDARKKLLL